MAETSQERIVRYLADAHAEEIGSLHALNSLAAEATDANLKAAVEQHATQTQSQADRLEARLSALGAKPNPGKGAVNTLISKGSDLSNVFHGHDDKQTQDAIKAYSVEHFEVGMYTSLHAYASAVGDMETAQLAKTILGEEQMAGEKLLGIIPQLAVLPAANGAS